MNKDTNQTPANQETNQKTSIGKSILLYIHDLSYLVAIMMLAFLLLFRVVVVSGPSMKNTLVDGDYLLLLSSVFYNDPQPGDIIVASKDSFENGVPIVKRVIAVEGQEVDIDFENGIVYVNGVALDEPYITAPTTVAEGVQFPLIVSEGCVFVLGDNRPVSLDSRNTRVGLLDKREILGKAFFLFLPGSEGGKITRDMSRIGVLK